MKLKQFGILMLLFTMFFNGCVQSESEDFEIQVDRFADIRILRYRVPQWDQLNLRQKKLVYYLSQAALSGRDIIYDQNNKYNLLVRNTLNKIVQGYQGDRNSDEFNNFMVYAKRVWFANGIHHHYSTLKFKPDFTKTYFKHLLENSKGPFPLDANESFEEFINRMNPIIFDDSFMPKRVNLNPKDDIIATSANNYYDGVTEIEVEKFYKDLQDPNDSTPIWYGLNSRVAKENGQVVEKVWKSNGVYGSAIDEIIGWLEKAKTVAESDLQREGFDLLIQYFQSGDLRIWDEYNMSWVKDTGNDIDYILGFIEVYGDAKGYKASYESVVQIKDFDATARMKVLSENGQWFEDNAPILDDHRREQVAGISYNVVTVGMLGGDTSPSSPIGINLPNSNWIRSNYGSKSVSLGNIIDAYDAAKGEGFLKEFAYSEEEITLSKEYGSLAGKLHTAMHEVLGHASGKLEDGIKTPKEELKSYASTIEEGRADLFGLYYILDPKLIDLGLIESLDVGKAEYNGYIRNGLMLQLRRLNMGEEIEESHMRNRSFISQWVYEKGQSDNVIEKKIKDGKTYFVVNDHEKLRVLFGELLKEIQRIKSQGDYEAAKHLVENYGVKVDPVLHQEVLDRSAKLNIPPYSGFMNPHYEPTIDANGDITDIKISYPDNFVELMLSYDKNYSFLGVKN